MEGLWKKQKVYVKRKKVTPLQSYMAHIYCFCMEKAIQKALKGYLFFCFYGYTFTIDSSQRKHWMSPFSVVDEICLLFVSSMLFQTSGNNNKRVKRNDIFKYFIIKINIIGCKTKGLFSFPKTLSLGRILCSYNQADYESGKHISFIHWSNSKAELS